MFGCSAYAYIKQDKLQPRAKKCVFLGYPEGIKGYRLWCVELGFQKCLISRDVRFNEEEVPMKKNINTAVTQKEEADLKLHFEVETDSNQPGEQSEEIEEEDSDQTQSSDQGVQTNYHLAKDRERRVIRPPQKFGYADLIAYVRNVEFEREEHDPETFKQAVNFKDKDKWIEAMEEEMISLHKNNTFLLTEQRTRNWLAASGFIGEMREY